MWSRGVSVTIIIAGLLAYPNDVAATNSSTWDFGTVCAPHLFKVCAGVSVTTIFSPTGAPAGTTRLMVEWSNPQGLPGFTGPITGLRSLTIRGFELADGSPVPTIGANAIFVGSTGNVTRNGAKPDANEFNQPPGPTYSYNWTIQEGGHLFGCDLPTWIGSHPEWDATCGGSITYANDFFNGDMRLGQNMSLELTWNVFDPASTSENDYLIEGLTCTTGVDCVPVPEPSSILLVLTGILGLVGMAASGRARRVFGRP